MRYTDEGNLRFVGNTRTSSSSQLCNVCGDLEVSGDLKVCGAIYGCYDAYFGSLCLGAPGDVCIYDQCGHDVFCSYNGDLCIYGCQFSNGSYTSNKSYIEMESDAIRICRDTSDGAFGISICNSDNLITFKGTPSSEEIKFVGGKTICTTSTCLELDNDVCVPDIFTIGSGSRTKCHYIHTLSLNGSSYTSTDGTLNLENITTTVCLDNNSSFLVTNCTFTEPPASSVVIGKNAAASAAGNIAIGAYSYADDHSVSIGVSSYSCDYALALGNGSTAANGNIAIGNNACANFGCFNYIVTRVCSTINTGSINNIIGFGSMQLLVKKNTLECDLYDVLFRMMSQAGPVEVISGPYLLLDKAIYRNEDTTRILGTGDYNIPIEFASSSEISIGNKMTVNRTSESAISLTCPNSYEIWNISY